MIPINTAPEFTSDWFSANIPRWTKHLAEYVNKPCAYLEIGSYEGLSSIWMMNNILTSDKSSCYCIDIWNSESIRRRFLNNLLTALDESQTKRFTFTKDSSLKELPRLLAAGKSFDIIYIDGQHHSDMVLMEFGMCWNLLKVGGTLIFDDYLYKVDNKTPIPMKDGIDNILANFTGKYELVESHYQLTIKKINS